MNTDNLIKEQVVTEKNRDEIRYQYARLTNPLQSDFTIKGKKFKAAFIDLVDSYNRILNRLAQIQHMQNDEFEQKEI